MPLFTLSMTVFTHSPIIQPCYIIQFIWLFEATQLCLAPLLPRFLDSSSMHYVFCSQCTSIQYMYHVLSYLSSMLLKMTFSVTAEAAGHLGAVLAVFVILALLILMAVMYVKCRLNALLWYQNRYGELEINGKSWVGWFGLFFSSWFRMLYIFRMGGGIEWYTLKSLVMPVFCSFPKREVAGE